MNKIIHTLLQHRLTIQTIESFTGGSLSHHFIKNAGASQWYKQGFVLYQTEAKANFLGISLIAVKQIDPVSEQFVKLCLKKGLEKSPNTITLVTTGNAGPTIQGQRQVGDFYVGISDGNHEHIQFGHAKGNRTQIQEAGLKMAMQMLTDFLSTYYVVSPK